jgi:hypothetical protein
MYCCWQGLNILQNSKGFDSQNFILSSIDKYSLKLFKIVKQSLL